MKILHRHDVRVERLLVKSNRPFQKGENTEVRRRKRPLTPLGFFLFIKKEFQDFLLCGLLYKGHLTEDFSKSLTNKYFILFLNLNK